MKKLETFGAHNNFFAFNDCPAWLAETLNYAAPLLPKINVLVLFADDLPDYDTLQIKGQRANALLERQQKLTDLTTLAFDTAPASQLSAFSLASERYGQINMDGDFCPLSAHFNQIAVTDTQYRLQPFYVKKAPQNAVIMLPAKKMTSQQFIGETLGLSPLLCAAGFDGFYHRAILGHELGHLLHHSKKGIKIFPAEDEKRSDHTAMHLCWDLNDSQSANWIRDWRLLKNIVSTLHPAPCPNLSTTIPPSLYWHSLSLYHPQEGFSQTIEHSSMLELKMHLMDDPTAILADSAHLPMHSFVNYHMDQSKAQNLTALYPTHAPSPLTAFCRLKDLDCEGETQTLFPHTATLAQHAQTAAYRTLPLIMR